MHTSGSGRARLWPADVWTGRIRKCIGLAALCAPINLNGSCLAGRLIEEKYRIDHHQCARSVAAGHIRGEHCLEERASERAREDGLDVVKGSSEREGVRCRFSPAASSINRKDSSRERGRGRRLRIDARQMDGPRPLAASIFVRSPIHFLANWLRARRGSERTAGKNNRQICTNAQSALSALPISVIA